MATAVQPAEPLGNCLLEILNEVTKTGEMDIEKYFQHSYDSIIMTAIDEAKASTSIKSDVGFFFT